MPTGLHLLEDDSGQADDLSALTIRERGCPLVQVGLLPGEVAVLVVQPELELVELLLSLVLLLLLALLEELPLIERKCALVTLGIKPLAMRHVATHARPDVAEHRSQQQDRQEKDDRYGKGAGSFDFDMQVQRAFLARDEFSGY